VTRPTPPPRSPRAGPPASARGSLWIGAGVAVLVAALDQVTKVIAERALERGEFVPWIGSHIGWQLVYNPGGAFGIPAPPWVFLVVTCVVVVLVARVLPHTTSRLTVVGYGLLLAGALGNVIDRLVRDGGPDAGFGGGWVVDFVAWGSFPRFNVADSAITVGFVLLVVALLRDERAGRGSDAAERALDRDSSPPSGPDAADA